MDVRTRVLATVAVLATLAPATTMLASTAAVADDDRASLGIRVDVDCSAVAADDCPSADSMTVRLASDATGLAESADPLGGTARFFVPHGTYTATVRDEDADVASTTIDFTGSADLTTSISYTPAPSAVVNVAVVDHASSIPVPPELYFQHEDGSPGFQVSPATATGTVTVRTRAFGTWLVQDRDDFFLSVTLPTYYPSALTRDAAQAITLTPGSEQDITLDVRPSALLEGSLGSIASPYFSRDVTVYDAAGTFVRDAGTIGVGGTAYQMAGFTTGSYLLHFAGDDTHAGVWYAAGTGGVFDRGDATPVVLTEGSTTTGIDVDPPTCGTVSGTLLGYGATTDADLHGYKGDVEAISVDDPSANRSASLDEHLDYTIKGLAPGRYRVAFQFHGWTTEGGNRLYYWHGDTTTGETLTVDSCSTALSQVDPSIAVLPVSPPAVSGTAHVGGTLTASTGAWSLPAAYGYRWTRDGSPIAGATGPRYVLTPSDGGHKVAAVVTASHDLYEPGTAATAAVDVPAEPQVVHDPAVSGVVAYGHVLRVTAGTWSPAAAHVSYQWLRAGSPITGATSSSYRLARADIGKAIAVRVSMQTAQGRPGSTVVPITVSVPKIRTSVSTSFVDAHVRAGANARLRVKVGVAGAISPRGTLTVHYRDGLARKSTTVTLHASAHGRATITIPHVRSSYHVTVTFKPSTSWKPYLATSSSAPRHLTVR